jgi:hypothetical protein
MSWRGNFPGSSRKNHQKFRPDPSNKTPAQDIDSCLMIVFALLFGIPMVAIFLVGFFSAWGERMRDLCFALLFLGLGGYLLIKGRRGLLYEEITFLPEPKVEGETSFVGGQFRRKITGKMAKRVSVIVIVLGAVALLESLDFFLRAIG